MTTKEQWLLVGFAAAVLVGCITVLLHDNWAAVSEDTPGTVVFPKQIRNAAADKPSIQEMQPDSQPLIQQPITETVIPEVEVPTEPQFIGVAIMGAVRNPDLYRVEEGMRVADLIDLAGGIADNADVSDILLTAPLVDETTLTVPELPTVSMNENRIVARRNNGASVINPPWYRRSAAFQHVSGAAPSAEVSGSTAVVQNAPAPSSSGLLNINQATSEQLQQLPGIGPVFAERIITERATQPFSTVEDLKRVSGIAEKRLEAIRPFITAP